MRRAGGVPADGLSGSAVAREVLDAQRVDVWGAMRAKSVEAWLRVLADDFVLRTPGEPDRDRLAFVERMTSFPGEVVSTRATTYARTRSGQPWS